MSDSCVTNESSPAYEVDFYAWTQQQAKLLQEKKWSCLDIPNLVEEIECLGRQERQDLENRLGVISIAPSHFVRNGCDRLFSLPVGLLLL